MIGRSARQTPVSWQACLAARIQRASWRYLVLGWIDIDPVEVTPKDHVRKPSCLRSSRLWKSSRSVLPLASTPWRVPVFPCFLIRDQKEGETIEEEMSRSAGWIKDVNIVLILLQSGRNTGWYDATVDHASACRDH